MSLATRTALRTSRRCLHTSIRACNESSSSSTPTPSSLGFGDYTGRTRKLPTIPISPSSQRNVLRSRGPKSTQGPEQSKATAGSGSKETGRKRQPQERQKRQGRSPIQASVRQVEQTTAEPLDIEGDEFFAGHVSATPRNRGSGMKKVNVDLDLSSTPSPVKTRGQNRGRRASTSTSTSKRDGNVREKKAKAPVVPEVEDRSAEGIFGRASLLFPVRRGAREAERSFWAQDLQPADARKAEMARLAGSPAVYLPDKPLPTELTGKNALRASKMLSTWLLATNPGVSMRRAKGGQAVIDSYLK